MEISYSQWFVDYLLNMKGITLKHFTWVSSFLFQVERVSHRDNMRSFVQKSEDLEKQCLAKAVKSYCELRVLPYERNKTVVF